MLTGSSQISLELSPVVTQQGYCLGETVLFSCTLRFPEMSGFDNIEWEIVQSTDDTSNLGAVIFLKDVTSTSLRLTFMGTTFQASATFHSTVISSTLTVVIPAQLNGLIIVCHSGGIQNSTSAITVTSECVSCYCIVMF